MIRTESLTVAYEGTTAIEDVDLAADRGEFVTVVGPSGCGKTTLLRTIAGLQVPTAGRVRIGGRDPEAARREGTVGVVFQRHTLLPWKSALENVAFLRRAAGKDPDPDGARALLETVGLDGYGDARPAALSGGMKQRVAIARALHLGADVLLMDEPFGELDEITRDEMGVTVRRAWRTADRTVVFVTHSVPEAVFLADRCLVMSGGSGGVDHEVEVDLPRPRDSDVFSSDAFQRQVAAVREFLHGDDDRTE
ncbi:MAG: ABC transporter ATP-binding protein [Halosimplex sp.]